MTNKLLLFLAFFLPFAPVLTQAQTSYPYTGTFTNTTLTQGGVMFMSMNITAPDSIHGYVNFTQNAGQSPLCGAGSYNGRIINDSLFLSFTSHDTDNSCGFDHGWLFSLRGRFYANQDSIAGYYAISNTNNETGFFNIKRPPTTAVNNLQSQEALVFPNPSNGKLKLKLPAVQAGAMAVITDQLGARVLVKQLNAATTDINFDAPDGVYFISVVSGELRTTQKFVVRH